MRIEVERVCKRRELIGIEEKTLGDSGRILVRESGIEPVVRVMVEAETTEICQAMVNKVVEVMKRKGL